MNVLTHAMPDGGDVELAVAYEARLPGEAHPVLPSFVRATKGEGSAGREVRATSTTKDVGSGIGLVSP